MNHLERALDGQNQFWKYLVNFLAAFVGGNLVGSIPLVIVIMVKTIEAGGAITQNPDNYADLTGFGITANLGLFLMMLPLVAGLFTCIALLRPLHNRSFAEVVNGTKQIRWQRVFTGFGIWFLLYALYIGISYAFNPDNFVFQFEISAFIPLLLISIFIIPLQTTFEELMFRGYLGQGIGAWTRNRWLVMIIPALLFGLMHSANPEVKEYGFWVAMPQYILFGLVFGLTTVLDDGIEISMGVHAANNIFAALFITNKSSVLQTPAVFNQQTVDVKMETLALLFMSVVLIVALTIIYQWDFKALNKKVGKAQIQS